MAQSEELKLDGKNVEVKLKNVRLSFFHGFDPQEGTDDTDAVVRYNYNVVLLIRKDDPQIELVRKAVAMAKKAGWGDSPPNLKDKVCVKDGEPDGQPLYDGYEGCFAVSASRSVTVEDYEKIKKGMKKRPISIIGPKRAADGKFRELDEGDEYAPYSGCYGNAIIRIYPYMGDTKKKRPARITASLEAVQFKAHGEAFGSRRIDSNSAFDEEDDDGLPESKVSTGGAAEDECPF